jgi:hypothetical protein
MRSLRTRLLALWLMLAVSAAAIGFVLFEFYRQSANSEVMRAEDAVARSCRDIGERYAFVMVGWDGSTNSIDDTLRQRLVDAVQLAFARAPGVEGGIWQADAGSLAYAFSNLRRDGAEDGPSGGGAREHPTSQWRCGSQRAAAHGAADVALASAPPTCLSDRRGIARCHGIDDDAGLHRTRTGLQSAIDRIPAWSRPRRSARSSMQRGQSARSCPPAAAARPD